MNDKSIGLIELSSVAAGFQVADAMLKAGDVKLYLSRSICSGKYVVLIAGAASAVESAVGAGVASANGCLIDSFVVAQVHPDVLAALGRSNVVPPEGALGVLESFNVATLLRAADVVAKTANVQLLEIRLAMALGGKAFFTVTGDVASVQAAVAAGRAVLAEAGLLVNAVVLPRPHPELYREIVWRLEAGGARPLGAPGLGVPMQSAGPAAPPYLQRAEVRVGSLTPPLRSRHGRSTPGT